MLAAGQDICQSTGRLGSGRILNVGDRIDRYELLCPLADGGMAHVWLARMRGARGFEKLFALKVIRRDLEEDSGYEQMFLDEARLTAPIVHPNIAQTVDFGEDARGAYLVMEWIDGESLSTLRRTVASKGEPFPLPIALRVIQSACAGLHAAHEARGPNGELLGIVHRDVSPQNILLSTTGGVKVIDFGVAKAADRVSDATRDGQIKGKLSYMPPEQAAGDPIDRRADVWGLGACLYELIAGTPPHASTSQRELYAKLLARRPVPDLPPHVPEPVRAVVMKSLALEVADRYQSAQAFERAIGEALTAMQLSVSSEDVAALVQANLSERHLRRKEEIAVALKQIGAGESGRHSVPPTDRSGERTSLSMTPPRSSSRPPRGSSRRHAALGIVFGAAIAGLIAFGIVRSRDAAFERAGHASVVAPVEIEPPPVAESVGARELPRTEPPASPSSTGSNAEPAAAANSEPVPPAAAATPSVPRRAGPITKPATSASAPAKKIDDDGF
jgi:serine/threonine-protein kinase